MHCGTRHVWLHRMCCVPPGGVQVNSLMNDAFLIRDRNSSLRPPKVRASKRNCHLGNCHLHCIVTNKSKNDGIFWMPRTQRCCCGAPLLTAPRLTYVMSRGTDAHIEALAYPRRCTRALSLCCEWAFVMAHT